MLTVVLLYIIIGVLEYVRVAKDYLIHLQEDFPFHPIALLEFCIFLVCLFFGPPLLVIKLFSKVKQIFRNIWKKIIFPFRLKRFSEQLNKVSEEKNNKKSVELLFKAMREVLK